MNSVNLVHLKRLTKSLLENFIYNLKDNDIIMIEGKYFKLKQYKKDIEFNIFDNEETLELLLNITGEKYSVDDNLGFFLKLYFIKGDNYTVKKVKHYEGDYRSCCDRFIIDFNNVTINVLTNFDD